VYGSVQATVYLDYIVYSQSKGLHEDSSMNTRATTAYK